MSQPHPANRPDPQPDDYFPDDLPAFTPGQCVVHRRYGYRGVVVDFDMSCHADEEWYRSNQTQPAIHQPWYHILVHDSSGNTYVAQENLLPDATGREITHPLVAEFFEDYRNGKYERNDAIWPSW
ncbi:MAG: heat shock protein HspQ [Planctomycetota bacterium]